MSLADFKKYSAGEISSLITKGASPRWQGFEYTSDGLLFVTSENVRDGFLDISSPKFLPPEFDDNHRRSQLKEGDILINIVGASIGRSCQFMDITTPANINQAVCLFRVKPEHSAKYVAYYLQLPQMVNFLKGNTSEGAQPNLSLTDIKDLKLVLPPLADQERIVEILSDADATIAIAEKSREKHEIQFHSLMRIFFDDENTSNWREAKISDLGSVVAGGTPASGNSAYWNGGVNWATPTDITGLDTRHISLTENTISQAGLANSSATLLPKKSLLVCTRATIGDCAINQVEMCTNQGFKNIIPNENVDIDFLYFLVRSGKREIIRRSAGSTFLETSGSEFASIPVRVPGLNEQISIANALVDATKLTEKTDSLITALKKQKRGLMQQLLTGKLRVPEKQQAKG